jgi:hypothetical protein
MNKFFEPFLPIRLLLVFFTMSLLISLGAIILIVDTSRGIWSILSLVFQLFFLVSILFKDPLAGRYLSSLYLIHTGLRLWGCWIQWNSFNSTPIPNIYVVGYFSLGVILSLFLSFQLNSSSVKQWFISKSVKA